MSRAVIILTARLISLLSMRRRLGAVSQDSAQYMTRSLLSELAAHGAAQATSHRGRRRATDGRLAWLSGLHAHRTWTVSRQRHRRRRCHHRHGGRYLVHRPFLSSVALVLPLPRRVADGAGLFDAAAGPIALAASLTVGEPPSGLLVGWGRAS